MIQISSGENYFIAQSKDQNLYYFGIKCDFKLPEKNIYNNSQISIDLENLDIRENEETPIYSQKFLKITAEYSDTNRQNIDVFLTQFVSGENSIIDSKEKLDYVVELIKIVFSEKNFSKIGLIGELLFIYNYGIEYIKYWHTSSKDVYDFVSSKNIHEIKTTSSTIRNHILKYSQLEHIINEKRESFIVSIIIKTNNPDTSLQTLVNAIDSKCDDRLRIMFKEKLEPYRTLINNEISFNMNEARESIELINVLKLKDCIKFTEIVNKDKLSFSVDFSKLVGNKSMNTSANLEISQTLKPKRTNTNVSHYLKKLLEQNLKILYRKNFGYKENKLCYIFKISKLHDGKYYWYSITEKNIKYLNSNRELKYCFICSNKGYCIVDSKDLLNYLKGAKVSLNKDGTIKHRHLYIRLSDKMANFYNSEVSIQIELNEISEI